jgi:hypothetical protein
MSSNHVPSVPSSALYALVHRTVNRTYCAPWDPTLPSYLVVALFLARYSTLWISLNMLAAMPDVHSFKYINGWSIPDGHLAPFHTCPAIICR